MPSATPAALPAALRDRLARMEAKLTDPELLAKLNPLGRLLVARCLRAARKDVE